MKEGTYLGGIRTVADLRDRCRIKECGCWEWAYSCSSNGRPSVSMLVDGKRSNMNGRRAALTLANGKVPPKQYLAIATKDCDNSLCVNPDHCRLARVGEMRREMARNATAAMRAAWIKNGRSQGHRLAKLTIEQVQAIKNSDKSAKELAAEYGMSVSNMHRIRAGKAWRDAGSGLAANSSVFNWKGAA